MKKFLLNKLIQSASKVFSLSNPRFKDLCIKIKESFKVSINKSRVSRDVKEAIKDFKENMKTTRTLKEAKFNAVTLSNEIITIAKNATFDVKVNGKVILMYQNNKIRINLKGLESLFFELFDIVSEGLLNTIISFIVEKLSTSFTVLNVA